MHPVFETDRLLVREWTLDDAAAAFRVFGDPEVMRYAGGNGHAIESVDAMRDRLALSIERSRLWGKGLGYWAVERRSDREAMGTIFLKKLPDSELVEVGWYLAQEFWGNGYATEAARAAVNRGFDEAGQEAIYALMFPENFRSRRVAEKCGMQYVERTSQYYDAELDMMKRMRV